MPLVVTPSIALTNSSQTIVSPNGGTWERLADVVYKGGAKSLKAKGIQAVGTEKTSWAKNIGNYLEVTKNKSPSFMFFVNCIREYLKVGMA